MGNWLFDVTVTYMKVFQLKCQSYMGVYCKAQSWKIFTWTDTKCPAHTVYSDLMGFIWNYFSQKVNLGGFLYK